MEPSSIGHSELIINDKGCIYHLGLHPDELADTVITVGDPDRVAKVSRHFDSIEIRRQHREFVTHTGYLGHKRISVVSTGIGPDNVDIVLNELDALVNIDFTTRTIKPANRSLNIIRMGTSGASQASVAINSLVVSSFALGLDNLLHFYQFENNEEERSLLAEFMMYLGLDGNALHPYMFQGSVSLLHHFINGFTQGITVTCPGFYAPQGRVLRQSLAYPQLIDKLTGFQSGSRQITNFEMETAALYGLGRTMGHHCLSISTIVDNRITKEFSADSEAAIGQMIQKCLPIISSID